MTFGKIGIRNMMCGKRPYRTELEYIESTGTQYIDTGTVATNTCGVRIDIETAQKVGNVNVRIFGTHEGNVRVGFALYGTAQAGGYTAFFGWNGATPLMATIPQRFVTTLNYKNDRKAIFNGMTYISSLETLGSLTESMYLLNANYNGSPFANQYVVGKIYSAQITDGSEVIHDYIPVLDWDGNAKMFDQVTQTYPAHYGTFVAGPEIHAVEYIESTGTQYINCDVSVASGDSFEMSIAGAFTGTSSAMQLNGVNGGAYFGKLTNGNYTVGGLDTNVAADANNHNFVLSATMGGSKVVSLGVDGATYTRTRNNDAGKIGLFTLLFAETGNPASYYCKMRLSSASISKNNSIVRRFLPIRVGYGFTWEGAMLDTVERKVYRNQGSGAFVIGPDVEVGGGSKRSWLGHCLDCLRHFASCRCSVSDWKEAA